MAKKGFELKFNSLTTTLSWFSLLQAMALLQDLIDETNVMKSSTNNLLEELQKLKEHVALVTCSSSASFLFVYLRFLKMVTFLLFLYLYYF